MTDTPPFKPDELTSEQREFLAWAAAVDINGGPRYGTMPMRGASVAYDALYDAIKLAWAVQRTIAANEAATEAARQLFARQLEQAAGPPDEIMGMLARLQRMHPGAKLEVMRNRRGFVIQGYARGDTIIDALAAWMQDRRSLRTLR